jgi:hypothetical protein
LNALFCSCCVKVGCEGDVVGRTGIEASGGLGGGIVRVSDVTTFGEPLLGPVEVLWLFVKAFVAF